MVYDSPGKVRKGGGSQLCREAMEQVHVVWVPVRGVAWVVPVWAEVEAGAQAQGVTVSVRAVGRVCRTRPVCPAPP